MDVVIVDARRQAIGINAAACRRLRTAVLQAASLRGAKALVLLARRQWLQIKASSQSTKPGQRDAFWDDLGRQLRLNSAFETRALLRERFGAGSASGLKALLVSAPLEGIELNRERDFTCCQPAS